MSVAMRQRVEKIVVRKLISDLLAAGFQITVSLERGFDLDECLLASTDHKKIMAEAFAGDECHLFAHEAGGVVVDRGRLNAIGWVLLVFGNDGWDVISDYTISLEKHLVGANNLADKYQ